MLSCMKTLLGVFLMLSYLTAGDLLLIGTDAPDFELMDARGKMHKLSDYMRKKLIIYFYPKDDTPCCTKEACNMRDNYESLQKENIVILGISYDDTQSHHKFSDKYQLPFTLLSDTEKRVADLYGAKGGLLGFIGAKRITYLIDESGKIMHVFDNVDSGRHSEQILEVLKEKDNTEPDTTSIE